MINKITKIVVVLVSTCFAGLVLSVMDSSLLLCSLLRSYM